MQKIFIGLFLLLLIFPLCFFNKEEISKRENRTLARFPSLIEEGGFNHKFGKEFEEWFADHFFKREQIIALHARIRHKINGRIENDKAFVGDNGWIFEKKGIIDVAPLSQQKGEIEYTAYILKRFDDKFKDKGIPVYLVLLPDRNKVYKEYWERYYTPKPTLDYDDEIKKALSDHDNIKIVSVENDFIRSPDKDLYFYKDDVHMTFEEGRFKIQEKVYNELLKSELKELTVFPERKENVYVDKDVTYVDYQFPNKERYKESEQKSFTRQTNDEWGHITEVVYRKGFVTHPAPINKSFFSLGPCYAEDIFNLFKAVFKESAYIRINLGDNFGQDAKNHQINEIRKLFTLEPNSAVIIVTQDYFEYIEQALEE